MKCQSEMLDLLQIKTNLLLFMCVLYYLSFVCISAYANVYFKTTIIKQNIKIIFIAGVPSSQALPGFLITAPPSVCVPDVIGVLAVWIQKIKNKKNQSLTAAPHAKTEDLQTLILDNSARMDLGMGMRSVQVPVKKTISQNIWPRINSN